MEVRRTYAYDEEEQAVHAANQWYIYLRLFS